MKLIVNNQEINLKICTKFKDKFMGLMFKKDFNYSLLFPKCNGIHTFFMKENIDIILTNKENKIIYIIKNLKPNKIILPKKDVYNTFELPVNKIKVKINDYIIIKE